MSTEQGAGVSRLFLSCDLTGSTNYKQKRADGLWRKTFLQFYREFPQEVANTQVETKSTDLEFHLWKPVGDELIFTVDVGCEMDVYRAVRTWTQTMRRFDKENLDDDLGTKGGAFIATFPGPDSESSIPRTPLVEKFDRDVVDLNREAIRNKNKAQIRDLYLFDYFGPSIDTGFRILSQCTSRFFTLSIEAAYAISLAHQQADAAFEMYRKEDFVMLGAVGLKGVWGGREYPVFALDLDCDDNVHKAMVPFAQNASTAQQMMDLCQACYRGDNWPFVLYLPNAINSDFHAPPVDPLRDYPTGTTAGAETVAPETASPQDLRDDAPLG